METDWTIGPSPIEAEAHPVLSVYKSELDLHSGGLARLPLSPRKTGGGVRRTPVGVAAAKVELAVSAETYSRHLRGDSSVYLWMRGADGEELVNRFLINRSIYFKGEDGAYQVRVVLEATYRGDFSSVDELLEAEQARPDGDFANKNCGCRGDQEGIRDWFQRATRRSPYVYDLSWTVGSETETAGSVQVVEPRYFVSRVAKGGRVDWQCACGAWTEVEPDDRGKQEMTILSFADARSAHDHMRRLRNGVPQRWELIVAISSMVSAAAFVTGEIVIPLINSHGH